MANFKDKAEFDRAVIELRSAIKPYAVKLTQNTHDAEDLVQETMLKAFKNRDKYRKDTNLKAWLVVIMRNLFINGYRKRSKRRVIHDNTPNNYIISSNNKEDNKALPNLMFDDIYKMVMSIPETLSRPLMMMYEGFKYQEIADATGVPLGTVKSRIHLARQRLSEQLVGYRRGQL